MGWWHRSGARGATFCAVVAGSLTIVGPPAHASIGVCSNQGRDLTITIPEEVETIQLLSGEGASGYVKVFLDGVGAVCSDAQSDPYLAARLSSVRVQSYSAHPIDWTLGGLRWSPSLSLSIGPEDSVKLVGRSDADHLVALSATSFSLDDDPTGELTFDHAGAELGVGTQGGNDVLDLGAATGWAGITLDDGDGDDQVAGSAGPDVIWVRPGRDQVDAKAGSDLILVTDDEASDTVAGGGGQDALRFDVTQPDRSVVVDERVASGDGPVGNDSYLGIDRYYGTRYDDEFIAGASGLFAIGGEGMDRFVSGPGDDRFIGSVEDSGPAGSGDDTVSYEASPSAVTISTSNESNEGVAIGHGTDALRDTTVVVGTPYDDEIALAAGWVRPGLGDDKVTFARDGVLISEEFPDGSDTVRAQSVSWDYSLRSHPIQVSVDGLANDGAVGERDNVWAERVRVQTGSGDDTLSGHSGRDNFDTGSGDDRALGSGGADYFSMGSGADVVRAGSGQDVMYGMSGSDVLLGGAGDDELRGGGGVDEMRAGAGDDHLLSQDRVRDLVDGGLGFDRVEHDPLDRLVSIEGPWV